MFILRFRFPHLQLQRNSTKHTKYFHDFYHLEGKTSKYDVKCRDNNETEKFHYANRQRLLKAVK